MVADGTRLAISRHLKQIGRPLTMRTSQPVGLCELMCEERSFTGAWRMHASLRVMVSPCGGDDWEVRRGEFEASRQTTCSIELCGVYQDTSGTESSS